MRFHHVLIIGYVLFLGCGVNEQPATAPKAKVPAELQKAQSPEMPAKQGHDSPAKVHAAYIAAIERKEWGKAFDCLTPDRQDLDVLGLFYGLAIKESDLAERHLDRKQFDELTATIDPERGDEQVMSAVLKTMRDKRAFYLDAAAELAEDLKQELPRGPLRNITVQGGHATAVVTTEADGPLEFKPGEKPKETFYEVDEEIPFSLGPDGWLIDAPAGSFPKVGRK